MDHIKLLKDLIHIKSYSNQEAEITTFISQWFKEKGIESFIQDKNLIVHIKGKDNSRALIFNSHLDTVSAGDATSWNKDPWRAYEVKDKLIGLGASDMKSGVASSMILCNELKLNPPVDMWFTYVVGEELDGRGTKSFVKWFTNENKYSDVAAIFTEPTGLVEIEHGHRGNIFLTATSKGDSGHGSRPQTIKVHAVRKMIKFADELKADVEKWRTEYRDKDFGFPTVGELTSIYAGDPDSPNKFPSTCKATFDIRTTPDFHKLAFEKIVKIGNFLNVKVSYAFPEAPAGYTDPSEKIVKVAMKSLKKPKLTVSQGAADLGFLTEIGVKAIILGPGEKLQAHMPNEYCHPEQIKDAVDIYKNIVLEWAK